MRVRFSGQVPIARRTTAYYVRTGLTFSLRPIYREVVQAGSHASTKALYRPTRNTYKLAGEFECCIDLRSF